MTNPISRSLAQQEEYRVRDREPRGPQTNAGRLLLMSGLTFHSGRRLADFPELVADVEAEAVLLARPVDRLPDNALYSNAVTHGYHTQSGDHECREYVVGVCALPALLARRAPGDRATLEAENAHLRELLALRPSGHTGPLDDRIPWFIHCGISHGANRPDCIVCRALAADSRPEQPE